MATGIAAGAASAVSFTKLWRMIRRKPHDSAASVGNGQMTREYALGDLASLRQRSERSEQLAAQRHTEVMGVVQDLARRVAALEGRS